MLRKTGQPANGVKAETKNSQCNIRLHIKVGQGERERERERQERQHREKQEAAPSPCIPDTNTQVCPAFISNTTMLLILKYYTDYNIILVFYKF